MILPLSISISNEASLGLVVSGTSVPLTAPVTGIARLGLPAVSSMKPLEADTKTLDEVEVSDVSSFSSSKSLAEKVILTTLPVRLAVVVEASV